MAIPANRRLAAACAGVTLGLIAMVLARRGSAHAPGDASREAFLEQRLARMRAARIELVSTRNGGAA